MNVSIEELTAVFPQASPACRMELHNLVLQRRIAQLEEELDTQRKANAMLEEAVKGKPCGA